MILLENTVTASPEQWRAAIMGARNPMNSWDKSDSAFWPGHMNIGENDLGLMKRLVAAGTDHSKFMRFLPVTVDVTAPLYWLKEMDTYKVGTVANSCSTMHKIQAKEFTLEDFSHEHCTTMIIMSGSVRNIIELNVRNLKKMTIWHRGSHNVSRNRLNVMARYLTQSI